MAIREFDINGMTTRPQEELDEILKKEEKKEVDIVNDPPHYKARPIECIDEMLLIFPPQVVYNYCICAAWKYRYRAPFKGSETIDQRKSDWYIAKAQEIKNNYSN